MKVFFSYPHDHNGAFVRRLKLDLEARGHSVWFDEAKIRHGDDWRNQITRGILESEAVVAFLSKHAVRDPGVCLNEIAIAMAEKGDEALVTVLVENETEVSAPISVTHIQWLRMEEHLAQGHDEGWYRARFDELAALIEHPSSAGRHEELSVLKKALNPLSFHADIAYQLRRFTGRRWLVDRYEDWLSKPAAGHASRVFRIEGGPGMGKTAVASYLAHATKSSVLAVHLCKSGSAATHSAVHLVMSLAYQMATRLPDYRARLLQVPCIKNPALLRDEDAGSLWDALICEPLAGAGKSGLIDRQRLAIVIDGLDEASKNGQNAIVELLVDHIQSLPAWVAVVLTGRPDPELTQSLAHYHPQLISGDDPANLDDLRHYIDDWLNEEQGAGRLHAHEVAAARQALLDKSEGAFLYLAQAREEAQQSRLDGSNGLDLRNPAGLPSGLNALYLKSFKRRFPEAISHPDDPNSRWNARVKPLLGYLLASPEPLPLDLARALLGWDNSEQGGDEHQHQALHALGSLIKRSGDIAAPAQCTLAPFHNSVREWLGAEAAQAFRVFAAPSLYPLTEATWRRYLHSAERDAYAWQVLPELLPRLRGEQQDTLFGTPDWVTSQTLYRLADSLAPKLRFSEAAATWVVQVRFSERLSRSAPENAEFARDLSVSYNKLGEMQHTLGNSQAALALYQQSLEIAERLSRGAPENAEFARSLSISYNKLGDFHLELMGDMRAALTRYELGLAITERLAAGAPEDAEVAQDLSISYNKLGDIERLLRKRQAALTRYQQALVLNERLAAYAPENAEVAVQLSISYRKMGDMREELGDCDGALDRYQQSLIISERLATGAPENTEFALNLSANYICLGNVERVLSNGQAALAHYQQALVILERLAAAAPENAIFAGHLCSLYKEIFIMEQARGDSQAALARAQQFLLVKNRLAAADSANADHALSLSRTYVDFANILRDLGDSQSALTYYQQGLAVLERVAAGAPKNTHLTQELIVRYERLGDEYEAVGNSHAALDLKKQALVIRERQVASAPENAMFADNLRTAYSLLGGMEKALAAC